MIGKLLSKIQYSTPETIIQQSLHEYLVEVKTELHAIANAVNQYYFART